MCLKVPGGSKGRDILAEDDDPARLAARGPRPRLTLQADADFLKVFRLRAEPPACWLVHDNPHETTRTARACLE